MKRMIIFLRKVFIISPILVVLLYIFLPDFINFIQNFYNEYNTLFLTVISIILILYIVNIIALLVGLRNRVNITYYKDGDVFKLKGKKDNFIIIKNGKHSFLVKDGMIVAYKPLKLFSSFKYYKGKK